MRTFILMAMVGLGLPVAAASTRPEIWFHIIGGNASKEGMAADIAAIAEAGIGGIQLFHGHADGQLWPGVTNAIPCMSEQWLELVKFAETECHRHGLTFKMQNCPGWSMSGGPWVTPDKAMRKLVCFEPGQKPAFDVDDDYHEIGEVSFPWWPVPQTGGVSAITFPNPQQINHGRAYEPKADFVVYEDDREVFRRAVPQGAWQDSAGLTYRMPRRLRVSRNGITPDLRVEVQGENGERRELKDVRFHGDLHILDDWESKAGWGLRSFTMQTSKAPVATVCTPKKTLVFGHVNAKRRNHPAPPEATGWECDKMDAKGFEANWDGYLGKVLAAGVKLDGTLVDSWECGVQSWTWKMEEEFEKRNGYALRPWLPALFGYTLTSQAETERFLLDWRNTCSRLIEENYYGTMARLAHANGMRIQFETAFGDVIVGDILRYWKYADEPMCEFWSPHDNANAFVYSHDFKAVLPCVSAAHVYAKRRVSAESLTSFALTFDENFNEWKRNIDRHFGRGVTHIVFHTYTHNPVVGGKPPSTSFGGRIGSPFLRGQPWWGFMKDFTDYIAFCGHELERGRPAVDILMYLGDDVNHKPSESTLLFDNQYKYDYCNGDVLQNRLAVKDGRLTVRSPSPRHAPVYRVLWIPEGTFLLPETEKRLADLEAQGARVIRGAFTPDWPSPILSMGRDGRVVDWYQRQDGEEEIFFVASPNGESQFAYRKDGVVRWIEPLTRKESLRASQKGSVVAETIVDFAPVPQMAMPSTSCCRAYRYAWTATAEEARGQVQLDLGRVRDWAVVTVNGRKVCNLWCAPYVCDISEVIRPGRNDITIEVVSTLYNRLVLDARLPETERTTWTLCGPSADAPLHEAGLIGPVRLRLRPDCLTSDTH